MLHSQARWMAFSASVCAGVEGVERIGEVVAEHAGRVGGIAPRLAAQRFDQRPVPLLRPSPARRPSSRRARAGRGCLKSLNVLSGAFEPSR